MEFLREKFHKELSANIDEDTGKVIIASVSFNPDNILKDLDPITYDETFQEWLEQRKESLLNKANEILDLYDNKGRFNRLKESYKKGAIIPFIGAGMSMPSGYPSWTTFLWKLLKETRVTDVQLKDLLNQGLYEEAAQLFADNMPANSFDEAIENTFEHDYELDGSILFLPHVFNTSIITTNFDNVLKRCYDNNSQSFSEILLGKDADQLPKLLGEGKKVLVKLHGNANSQKGRVLTFSEYQKNYGDEPVLKDVIEAICTKSLLFIGCSLSVDRTIKSMKDITSSKGHNKIPRHYCFLSLNESDDRLARRDQLAEANIFPIFYPATDDHNECIEALLQKLLDN